MSNIPMPEAPEGYEDIGYNKVTGQLFRKGIEVGSYGSHKYLEIKLNGKRWLVHRLIMEILGEEIEGKCIDHINANKTDNRLKNLRIVDHASNMQNRRLQSNNTSGFNGVTFDKRTNSWKAQIRKSGKRYTLGRFKTPEEAHIAVERKKNALGFSPLHGNP